MKPSSQHERTVEILQIGTFLETDEQGYLINKSASDKLPSEWKTALDEMVRAYLENIGEDNIKSILVRGSVARGEPLDGISDIDTIAITAGTSSQANLWIRETKATLHKKYPFSTDFEFVTWTEEQVTNPLSVNMRFLLKTQAATVWGENIIEGIENFKPDIKLARSLVRGFNKDLQRGKERVETAQNGREIQDRCRWIAKRFLRKGFYLVMPRAGKFTKDLYPSYETFAHYYPERKQDMYEALYLAMNPTTNKGELLEYITDFGNWLQEEIKTQLN